MKSPDRLGPCLRCPARAARLPCPFSWQFLTNGVCEYVSIMIDQDVTSDASCSAPNTWCWTMRLTRKWPSEIQSPTGQKTYTNNPDFSKKCPGPVGSPKLTFHYMFLIPAQSSQSAFSPDWRPQCTMLKHNCFSEHIMQVVKKIFFKMGILYVVNFKRSKGGKQWDNKVKLYIFIISL